ncbi:hexokinase family protein [Aspergillus eucalypticola CBS 122712]|uniref:Phosphotransferase n=1 Tax=Aspergillus eucalypticola (strain CBS 122712 / IBT 29274) TaxID=1448314 RepID=A0A317VI68_ASPEC|nr:hexokinase family protein [Aspergillus eucalypticola CBS 122712]PWY72698.1 hexokinase family protein [Aspergillus eucalypticola CBS 122712]
MGKLDPDLQEFLHPLRIDHDTLYDLSHRLSHTYRELAASSSEQFFPTAITRLPTGHETGRYLAVYLGLSYLRVAFIDLLGHQPVGRQPHVRRTLEKAWPIEERLRRDQAQSLFAWIGDCIAEVIADDLANSKGDPPKELIMGISFCFPTKFVSCLFDSCGMGLTDRRQKFLNEAILMPTGKGFALSSSLNLHQALLDGYECHTRRSDQDSDDMPTKRRKTYCLPKLKVTVMTNDTVATLASLAYSIRALPNTRVVMGLIVGAGCNSAIPMKLADLQELKVAHIREKQPEADETVVSTEWTLHGATGPLEKLGIVTKWDAELEEHSNRPGFQPLEYMVGGRYIGELVRIISYDWFHGVKKIPKSSLPEKLVERNSLSTEFLSLVVASSSSNEHLAVALSNHLPSPSSSDWMWTPDFAGHIRIIGAAVQERSSALVAAATVGLLACTGEVNLKSTAHLETDIENPKPGKLISTQNDTVSDSKAVIPGWQKGPEELVVAVSGGVIQHYPHYKDRIQRHIDRLILSAGPQGEGKSVFLREASDGGIVGVGVLAGTAAGEIQEIIGSTLESERN